MRKSKQMTSAETRLLNIPGDISKLTQCRNFPKENTKRPTRTKITQQVSLKTANLTSRCTPYKRYCYVYFVVYPLYSYL